MRPWATAEDQMKVAASASHVEVAISLPKWLLAKVLQEMGWWRCPPPWKSASARQMPRSSIDNPAQAGAPGQGQQRCRRPLGWMTERLVRCQRTVAETRLGGLTAQRVHQDGGQAEERLGGRDEDFGAGRRRAPVLEAQIRAGGLESLVEGAVVGGELADALFEGGVLGVGDRVIRWMAPSVHPARKSRIWPGSSPN